MVTPSKDSRFIFIAAPSERASLLLINCWRIPVNFKIYFSKELSESFKVFIPVNNSVLFWIFLASSEDFHTKFTLSKAIISVVPSLFTKTKLTSVFNWILALFGFLVAYDSHWKLINLPLIPSIPARDSSLKAQSTLTDSAVSSCKFLNLEL